MLTSSMIKEEVDVIIESLVHTKLEDARQRLTVVRRLAGRGTESAEVMERRLAAARDELAAAGEFEVTLVNTSVQEVCRQLVTLINGQR